MVRRNLPDLCYLEEHFGVILDRSGVDGTTPKSLPESWMSHDLPGDPRRRR